MSRRHLASSPPPDRSVHDRAYHYYLLGQLACRESRLSQAVNYWRRSLQLNPRNVAARVALGETLLEMAQVDGAIKELAQAYAFDPALAGPPLAAALVTQARLWALVGDQMAALSAVRHALEVEPDNPCALLLCSRLRAKNAGSLMA